MKLVLVLAVICAALAGCTTVSERTLSTGQRVAIVTDHRLDLSVTSVSMTPEPGGLYSPVGTHAGPGLGTAAIQGVAAATIGSLLAPAGSSMISDGAFTINATGGNGGDAIATQ